MSIIHEALRKADREKSGPEGKLPFLKSGPRRGRFNGGLALVITVLLTVGTVALTPLMRKDLQTPAPKLPNWIPGAPAALPSPTPAGLNAQFGIEEMPLASAFALSGIVASNSGKSYAIINNEIVEQGQRIKGAVVESISGDRVVLSADGQKINLPANERSPL